MKEFAVFLSKNPGPFVEEDGPQEGAIVVRVEDCGEPPPPNYFAMAASELDLGNPRLSSVLYYLLPFDPKDWRNVNISTYTFWPGFPK